jgi:hypothetical protein
MGGEHGYEVTPRYALKAGASPSAVYYEDWKPMALACVHGHDAVVRLLLEHGVKPDTVDGWTKYRKREYFFLREMRTMDILSL